MTKVTVDGLDELKMKLEALGLAVSGDDLTKALMAAGYVLETAVKLDMKQPKSGRVYGLTRMATRNVYKTLTDFDGSKFRAAVGTKQVKVPRKHQASAPGESPAIDSSALVNSIMTEADGDGVLVGTNSEYAEPLEFGTARMQARPFLGPAAESSRDDMTDAAQTVLKNLVEGAV